MKWNVSVGVRLSIDYEGIEAATQEEAEEIAKDMATEDTDCAVCSDFPDVTVFCSWPEDEDENEEVEEGDVY
jgi:hypothetical protein